MPDDSTLQSRLTELRKSIDDIDQQILDLLARRLEYVLAVGDLKREFKIGVYDPERERRVLNRLIALARKPLEEIIVRRVFERIIDESRRAEQRHVLRQTLRPPPTS